MAAAVAVPFAQYDWPNPTRRSGWDAQYWALTQLDDTQAPQPFAQYDWPNPVRAKPNLELRTWIDGIPQTALALTVPPGQRDWPNPVVGRPNPALRTWTFSAQLQTAAAPFVQSDWPNPIGRVPNLSLTTWTQGLPSGQIELTVPPVQLDWPNPVLASPPRKDWSNPNLLPLKSAAQVEVPDVVGETQAAGTAELQAVLFAVAIVTAYSSTVAAGIIISQSPVGGSFTSEGSMVTITVSLGAQPAEATGGHYWPSPADQKKKRKDYRPALDEKRVREKQELRDLIARAAGLLDAADEAEAAIEPIRSAPRPEYRSQVAALRTELDKLTVEALDPEPVNLELHAHAVERIVAMATDDLVIRVAGMLEDLIQEIADESNE